VALWEAVTIRIFGIQLEEFVAALNELKLGKRDKVRLLQKTEPDLSVGKRDRVPQRAEPGFVALATAESDREIWSKMVRVAGGYVENPRQRKLGKRTSLITFENSEQGIVREIPAPR
jgi:hypothetical protein